MADYYPLIARAVAGLEKNTGEARRTLYERARSALVAQLRSTKPPMSESDITKERLALEEAIRRVEADTARKIKLEAQSPPLSSPNSGLGGMSREPSRSPVPTRSERLPEPRPQPRPRSPEPSRETSPAPQTASQQGANRAPRRPLSDDGLKGFRDVIAEAESLGQATAQASKSAREAFSAVPAKNPELDRMEPRVEPEGLRTPHRDTAIPRPRDMRETAIPRNFDASAHRGRDAPVAGYRDDMLEPQQWSEPADVAPRMSPRVQPPIEPVEALSHSRKGVVAAVLAVLLILILAGGVFWQRDRVASLFNAVKGTGLQSQRDAQPTRPKITDRVGQPSADSPSTTRPSQGSEPSAAVAQRVVLYEEDPAEPAGKRYVGSAIWRTETVTASGQQPELTVRADVEIPERRVTMTLTLRRNNDQALPASHTIEIMFNLPADFPFGGIANVPGILMKQAEATRGSPLAGLAVKVTSGFFLVGLSAADGDKQRNLELLRERGWFDIPVVYNNGRRAILAIEKGNPGDRAFDEAFAAWGQGRQAKPQ